MNQVPVCHSGGKAHYEQSIDLPIDSIYGQLVSFGTWNTWSPFYVTLKQVGDDSQQVPNGQDTKIARVYKGLFDAKEDRENKDELYSIEGSAKDGKVVLKYRNVINANVHIGSIETTITLTQTEKGKTNIAWDSLSKLKIPFEEKVEEYLQIGARVAYNFLGSKINNNPNDPLPPAVHPLDRLAKVQTLTFFVNTQALGLHMVIFSFKEEGFKLINKKMVSVAGQAILGNLPGQPYRYAEYPYEWEMPKMCAGIPVSEVLPPSKFGRLLERLLEMVYLQVANMIENISSGQSIYKVDFVQSVQALSHTYGSKQDQNLVSHLERNVGHDEELCQQLLQGVNPLMIEWIQDFNRVPHTMQHLSITENKKDVSVKSLFEQKRLFIVDYYLLENLPEKQHNKGMYFYAPYLLLYREDLPNGENRLNIVGVQLERTLTATVYTPSNTPKNLWTLVKMFVTSADNNIHEFGYHLGLSHLAIEPVCVAVHNNFPKTHALNALLHPHLDETIGINFLARNTLVDAVLPITDKTFVIGTLNGTYVASQLWQKYDFFGTSFPQQLAARGFTRNRADGDNLTSYYYRDDGFKLWDCFGNYTTNVVNTYYKHDSDVAADKCIQNWAAEMADPKQANVKGFPAKIETKKMLSDVLQIIIWNGSAFHSVINYSQWPYIGFINNRPNGLYRDVPKGYTELSDEELESSLATPFPRLFQILFPWLLSAPVSDDNLPALRAMNGEINDEFQYDLKQLTNFINDRNKELDRAGKTPYVFCLPENVACSVSI